MSQRKQKKTVKPNSPLCDQEDKIQLPDQVDKSFNQLLEKEDIQKLKEMELLEMQGRNFELQAKLDKALEKLVLKDKKNQELQVKLDERPHTNEEFLQEKRLQEIKQKEMDFKLQDMEKHNKGLQIKLNEALQKKLRTPPRKTTTGHEAVQTPRHGGKIQSASGKA